MASPFALGFVGFGQAAPAEQLVLDKTRFLYFGEGDGATNTATTFADQSGRGFHFTQNNAARRPVPVTDPSGNQGYEMTTDVARGWASGLTSPASNYTFYSVIDLTMAPMFMYMGVTTAPGVNLILGQGQDGLYFSQQMGAKGSNIPLPTGKALVVWNLDEANGAKVYVNGSVIYSGSYIPLAITSMELGQPDNTYAPVPGRIYAFAVAPQGDSAAQMLALSNYFRAKYNLP